MFLGILHLSVHTSQENNYLFSVIWFVLPVIIDLRTFESLKNIR
ncbi:Uncharacterized protein dnm_014090 [Desulfonema magnum]|uniref:Uncharacterized protein n=1 Tax=Desulfonema magnum TaxID=45655 RepID=A0A975BHK1_9BACT|nr:Uncharacterized protein dnm_014090 [Desulfonema magnum]